MKNSYSFFVAILTMALIASVSAPSHADPPPPGYLIGKIAFEFPLPQSNGRSCATCHVEGDHFALSPQHVQSACSNDPIFRTIDADDPNASTPTYEHLKRGLVRIPLPLAANLDEVDGAGNVITNAARTIDVWRGVPTIENTALTAPYQYDGRAPTYQTQAAGAFALHAQVPYPVPPVILNSLATFEGTVYSSPVVAGTAAQLFAGGLPPDPSIGRTFPPGSDEAAGQVIFVQACTLCHGGPRGNTILSQAAHDQTFFKLNPDGTLFIDPTTGAPVNDVTGHENDRFMNLGTSVLSYLHEAGPTTFPPPIPPVVSAFTVTSQFTDLNPLPLTRHRLRVYTDATRTTALMDLPPAAGFGPSVAPQLYTTDPGRLAISGDPADYEAFDVPQLRGLANTAPYMHDNSLQTLDDVVEFYSSRVLSILVFAANFPPVNPPIVPGGLPESLSLDQKRQLVAFLKTL